MIVRGKHQALPDKSTDIMNIELCSRRKRKESPAIRPRSDSNEILRLFSSSCRLPRPERFCERSHGSYFHTERKWGLSCSDDIAGKTKRSRASKTFPLSSYSLQINQPLTINCKTKLLWRAPFTCFFTSHISLWINKWSSKAMKHR